MGMYLDLDDAVAGHPKAKAELARLRAERDRLRAIHDGRTISDADPGL